MCFLTIYTCKVLLSLTQFDNCSPFLMLIYISVDSFYCTVIMINQFDVGLVGEDSSEAGFHSIRSMPGLQRGWLSHC